MAKLRTLSQLPKLSSNSITDDALFEIASPVEVSVPEANLTLYKYASKAITKKELTDKLISDVRRNFGDVNKLDLAMNFSSLCATVSAIGNSSFTFRGDKTFTQNPKINNDALSSYSSTDPNLDDYSVNYDTLKKYSSINVAPTIDSSFGFITHLSSDTDQSDRYLQLFITDNNNNPTNKASFVFDQNVKNIAQNEYIFRIEPGSRESKPWKAPASGIFTCYGWLDEMNNPSIANESRWVALMGYESIVGKWTILQLQPFAKNNYLSYVGFTFPVKRGMELKIVTGFAVGNNSDKYFASNTSIANHKANAFLGGIYTGLSNVLSGADIERFENVSGYVTDEDLKKQLSDYATLVSENQREENTLSLINELSSHLSVLYNQPKDEEEKSIIIDTSQFVKYVDTTKLSGENSLNYSIVRFGSEKEYGVFNDKIKQTTCMNGMISTYKCLSIDFNKNSSSTAFEYKNYYAPPDTFESRDGRVGTIERAYFPEEFPSGQIASDGQYYYYKVKNDCNLLLKFSFEIASGLNEESRAWILYDTERGYSNIKAIPLLEKTQSVKFNGRPSESIMIPVKRGTIIMIGVYTVQLIDSKIPMYWRIQPPVLTTEDQINIYDSLVDLKKWSDISNGYYFKYDYYVRADGQNCSRYAGLLRADGQNMNFFAKSGSTQTGDDSYLYNLDNMSFGNVCYIYELP